MKISWGTGITVSYLLFVLLILGVLAFAMGQDVNLVSPDYYEKELVYQEKIEKMKRTKQLHGNVEIEIINKNLSITFPQIFETQKISGQIILYRPSDRRDDRSIEINLEQGENQVFLANDLKSGLWRVKLEWESEQVEYYFEQNIIVE